MIRRIIAIFHARNLEFVRDRSSLAWNIMMPMLILVALVFILADGERDALKIGVYSHLKNVEDVKGFYPTLQPFLDSEYVQFIKIKNFKEATKKVARHKIDLVINVDTSPYEYVINEDSSKGYLAEKLLFSQVLAGKSTLASDTFVRVVTSGKQVSYLNWIVPGILGMNLMFGCLFGIGWVIVKYRKNDYLKRVRATPINAFEFICAQILSRLFITLVAGVVIYLGSMLLIDFDTVGSYFNLFIITILGSVCMISFGLLVAARISNEELASGILNVVSWPMMMLSELWFSLEGSPEYVKIVAMFFPLTHYIKGARAIIIDGSTLMDLWFEITFLGILSVVFLALACYFFRWVR